MKISNQQKNGIIQLSFLVIVFTGLTHLSKLLPKHTNQFIVDTEIEAVLNEQKCNIDNKRNNPKKFYVNTLNDYSAYKLGLNTNQIDTLLSFLQKGKLIYTLKEFTQITSLTKKQLHKIGPQLKFPRKRSYSSQSNFIKKERFYKNKYQTSKQYNLNTITAVELEDELKLPKFIAKRIVKYRKLLHGYKSIEQIENVYSILPYQVNRIKKNCYLK